MINGFNEVIVIPYDIASSIIAKQPFSAGKSDATDIIITQGDSAFGKYVERAVEKFKYGGYFAQYDEFNYQFRFNPLSAGAIAGIVVAVVFVLAFIALVTYYIVKRRLAHKNNFEQINRE